MIFFITFLEGIMTFLSPCLLPMIPIYLGYLAGKDQKQSIVKNALGFILGFTLMFSLLGLASGTIGAFFDTLSALCPHHLWPRDDWLWTLFPRYRTTVFLPWFSLALYYYVPRFLFSRFLRYRFFHWLDPMCRRLSWFGPHVSFKYRFYVDGAGFTDHLFTGLRCPLLTFRHSL